MESLSDDSTLFFSNKMNQFQKIKAKLLSIVRRGRSDESDASSTANDNYGFNPNGPKIQPYYNRRRSSVATSRKSSVMDRAPNIEHYRLDAAQLVASLSRPSLKELHQERISSSGYGDNKTDTVIFKDDNGKGLFAATTALCLNKYKT